MANKNKEMLKVFFGVMKNSEKYTNLVIPNCYVKNVYDIDYKKLYKKGYLNLIFDIEAPLDIENFDGIKNSVVEKIKEIDEKFNCVITVDFIYDWWLLTKTLQFPQIYDKIKMQRIKAIYLWF